MTAAAAAIPLVAGAQAGEIGNAQHVRPLLFSKVQAIVINLGAQQTKQTTILYDVLYDLEAAYDIKFFHVPLIV